MEEIVFKDIDGVIICPGDTILVTERQNRSSTAPILRSKVLRIKKRRIYFEGRWAGYEGYMHDDQTVKRMFVLKGEMKEYSVTKEIK